MLRQRYEPEGEFTLLLQLSGEIDEQMAEIDRLLDDDQLLALIVADLAQPYPLSTQTGRKSTPVEVILRMLALKHLRGLSYQQTRKNIQESLILRQFCRLYFNPLPHQSTLIRWGQQISQETLVKFNQRLTQIASQLQITKGQKLRTDGTVVETNIHFPSDNSLLVDGVKLISRLLAKAKQIIGRAFPKSKSSLFRNRCRTARRISRQIDSRSKTRNQKGKQKRKPAYQQLIEVTKASFKQMQKVQTLLKQLNSSESQKLQQKWTFFQPRIEQVIEQASRRVLQEEKVAAAEKIVSIFEAHTAIICRGKINLDVEFGRKVWLDELEGGIVSNYRILAGNPHDTLQLIPSLDQHLETFGFPPKTLTADRGVYSQANENYAQELGIKQITLPKGGYRSQARIEWERKRNFRAGRRWHNGVEGRISFLKRCFGFQRCLYRGESGFSRWIGWGIIAHNLTVIARSCAGKPDKLSRL